MFYFAFSSYEGAQILNSYKYFTGLSSLAVEQSLIGEFQPGLKRHLETSMF